MSIVSTKKALLALALTLTFGMAVTSPAKADDHHRGPPPRAYHDWDRHVRVVHTYRYAHPHYAPGYVYAPPAVVYPPPPPPSGINLILPLHFN